MIYLILAIIFVGSYLIGNFNFARVFSWAFGKKDITTVGSKNPGTMNMLRTRGFGEAMLTLAMEAVKSGLPAIICYFVIGAFEDYASFANLAYFVSAFGAIIGHCFPVFYKFKGGKGVACTFGMFTFHPNFWWISLIAFVICFLLMCFLIKYGSVVSFIYIILTTLVSSGIVIFYQFEYFIPILVILWLNLILILALHHKNIYRLCHGTENKIDLMEKIKQSKHKKSAVNTQENETNESETDTPNAEQEEKEEQEEKVNADIDGADDVKK